MNNYTIYCTEAQTKKALELGAPIKMILDDGSSNRIYMHTPTTYIKGIYGTFEYIIPTAEQMMTWLETQGMHIYAHKIKAFLCHNYRTSIAMLETKNYNTILHKDYLSSKEATLAAIDAALEYLKEKQKK